MQTETTFYSKYYIYICVFIVNILTFSGSLMLTWTSPIIPKLKQNTDENPLGRVITNEEDSWIGALLALGATFGPFIWGYLADKIGRKNTLLALSIPFAAAYVIAAFATIVELYFFARFLAGLALGGLYIMTPTYCSEVAEDSNRGRLSSAQNVAITLSTIFTYAVGPYTSIMVFNIICLAFTVAFFVLCLLFVTETPFYFAKTDEYTNAERSLMKYRARDSHVVQPELNVIKATVHMNDGQSVVESFRSRGVVKGLIISLALMLFQQFSGINVILFNTQTIFDATKSSVSSEISSMLVGANSFVFAIVCILLVDKLGRKILLIISAVGMLVSELILGVYFYLLSKGDDVDSINWIPIASLLVYIGAYMGAFGPLPWVILAELLPENIKTKISPIVSSFSWFLGFLLTKLYTNILSSLFLYGAFWLFTGFNAFALVFVVFVLPETKGKSFQEIQHILNA